MSRPFRALAAALLFSAGNGLAAELESLWDFSDPAASERRFRDALATASGDDALVLRTQIARSLGLRKDFDAARAILAAMEPDVKSAGAEPRARFELEMGRTFASATHPPASQTPAAKSSARTRFESALGIARAARLDGLAIDAIHMMAFLDTAPPDQEKWAREALAVVLASDQPAAKRWEASVRNNLGYALHQQGRLDEALAQFRLAVALRERGTNAAATRTAHWMVAWTLRALGRTDEALAIQLRLEKEDDAAGRPDPHVFDELALLYRAKGDEATAKRYLDRKRNAP
jgi:tetratricopeptide (TPR) repeat protein